MLEQLMAQGKIGPDSRIFYVDDGSMDHTWERMEALSRDHRHVAGITDSTGFSGKMPSR
jgi:hypothetical protein